MTPESPDADAHVPDRSGSPDRRADEPDPFGPADEPGAPCGTCGYRVIGPATTYCLECGAVNPRSADETDRIARTPEADLRLWCPACLYTVTGVRTGVCPECGIDGLRLLQAGQSPPRRRPVPEGIAGVPVSLVAAAALAVAVPLGMLVLGGLISKRVGVMVVLRMLAGSAMPVALATSWWLLRDRIAGLHPSDRDLLRNGAVLLALLLSVVGWLVAVIL